MSNSNFKSMSALKENVSRETFQNLEHFIALLSKWNKAINLVSYRTEDELWQRHILNSAELINYIPKDSKILTDLGSGGGFPGIIIAILLDIEVHLVESDVRKSVFLTEAAIFAKNKVFVHNARIEEVTPWESDVLTARALAPLADLITMSQHFIKKNKICLFQKGKNSVEEIKEAKDQVGHNYIISEIPISLESSVVTVKENIHGRDRSKSS